MSLSLPKPGRRSTILFTTIILILAAFAYYFLVHVEQNESQFIDRAYRVLDRKALNIQKKYEGYQNYLEYVYNSVDSDISEVIKTGEWRSNQIKNLNIEIAGLYDEVEGLQYDYESKRKEGVSADYNKITQTYDMINRKERRVDKLTSGLDESVNDKIAEILEEATPENIKLDHYSNADGSVYYQRTDYYYSSDAFSWFVESEDDSYVSFSESAETFIPKLLLNGFFHEFVLLKEGQAYDNTGDKFNYSIVYQTFSNPIDLISISPLLQSPHEKDLHDDSVYLAMGPKMIRPVVVDLYNESYQLMFHRMEVQGETFYLGGFVKSSVFTKESQKVEIFFLVLAVLIILLLLIAMPVLKLVFMSSIERLHIRNVVMVGGSIVLGVPIVLLIFFSVYEFVIQADQEIDNNLEYLSKKIESSFVEEVKTMVTLLLHSDYSVASKEGEMASQIEKLDLTEYNEYNHVFWINKEGIAEEDKQRTLLQLAPSRIDVGERDYYKEVMADRLWTLKDTTAKEEYDFFLQSIVSWNDFTNEVAVSIPSSVPDYPVAVLTSQLSSVMETILPVGYGFAIIDQDGLVKFHSESERILQENFLEETNNASNIRSSIYSRMPMNADVKYRNVNHRAYIQPINSFPLYMVTFYNNEYRNVEIQGVVSISIILLFSSFIAASIMIIVLHLVQRRRSKLRIKNFLFHWIKPEEDRDVEYQFLSFLFFLIGIVLLFMISNNSIKEQDILFTFIITNAYLFLISFSWLSPKDSTRYTDRPTERRNFNIAFILFILAADWVFLPFSSGQWWWLIYQIFLLGFVLFSRYWEKFVRAVHAKIPKRISKRKVVLHHSYNVYLFSWLLISSVLPIFFIFMVSHNEEEIIWHKYNQLKIAEQYQAKIRSIDSRVEALSNDAPKDSYFESKLNSGTYLVNSCISTNVEDALPVCPGNNSKVDFILSKIRPHYNELIIESKGLAFDISDEDNIKWCFPNVNDKNVVQLSYKDNYGPSDRTEYGTILIKSNLDLLLFGQSHTRNRNENILPVCGQKEKANIVELLRRNKEEEKRGIDKYRSFFFAVIILILLAVYFLIDYCTNKVYGREYTNFKNTLPLTISNFKRISIGDDSITHYKQRQIFLLGLPKSNKSNLLKNLEGKFYEADMMCVNDDEAWKNLLKVDYTKYDGVIIENFEYGVSSHEVNKKRLQFLEKLASLHTHQVVISSNVHPSFITDFYEHKLNQIEMPNRNKEEINQALETWRHILGGFIVVHNPIKENSKINGYLRSSWIKNEVFKQLFRLELNKGSFLPNLLPGIKDYFVKLKKATGGDETKIDKEDIILRIQLLAESYYLGLWNTLSKQEKYIIYDLAKDRFVNVNNKNGIRSLLEKGLLVYENELRIMNESFTNFVLSIIKKEEALKMEKEVRDKGTWSTISSVLGLAVLGILIFLFLGNPDFFQDFNALISVVIAIAGIIPRLGGLLSFGKSSTPATEGN